MNEEVSTVIAPITSNSIPAIDEENLPQIFTEQVRFLEKANQEYCKAEEKEKQARKNVESALKNADSLINAAKKAGGHVAETKNFLWIEYSKTKDEITALKKNLQEIIEHNEHSAEAQKTLAEVQASLIETQTATLQVQKAHMEYQRQIANATKFVFGLSAYNMATSQSILIKLKAILSGASEEQLGELAQQQLFLALDQIRNQESIITRINENDSLIENLNLEIEKKQKEIDEIGELDQEQNRRISVNETILDEHKKTLTEQQEKDAEHDKKISENSQNIDHLEMQDEKQDRLIAVGIEKDKEHDEKISKNTQDIDKLERQGETQDKKIELIENNLRKQIEEISESVHESNSHFEDKITFLSIELKNTVAELKGEMENQMKDITEKVLDLENRIAVLDRNLRKIFWKIAVSVVAGASLLLNILHLLGIL